MYGIIFFNIQEIPCNRCNGCGKIINPSCNNENGKFAPNCDSCYEKNECQGEELNCPICEGIGKIPI